MKSFYDTIIIGAGIAGLLTALRLSRDGQKIVVIEKDRIGSGSTMSNHGMVHSGALYVSQHGHIVKHCQDAQQSFLRMFEEAQIPANDSIYIAPPMKLLELENQLNSYGFKYIRIDQSDVPELNKDSLTNYELITLKERVFSSEKILRILTQQCIKSGVEFYMGTKIKDILIKRSKVSGIRINNEGIINSGVVIIAAGLGTIELLNSINSSYVQYLKSRLDMMVHLPHAQLDRGIIFAELDRPIVMPAINGTALGSYFGGIQPLISGDRKFSVDYEKAHTLIKLMKAYFNEKYINLSDAQFYMCGKTDYIGSPHTEKGFINPGFHIINHEIEDSINGLLTILTGKMTLAFHASKEAAEIVLKRQLRLSMEIDRNGSDDDIKGMLTVAPWRSVNEI